MIDRLVPIRGEGEVRGPIYELDKIPARRGEGKGDSLWGIKSADQPMGSSSANEGRSLPRIAPSSGHLPIAGVAVQGRQPPITRPQNLRSRRMSR
jgi:hypothetical protein